MNLRPVLYAALDMVFPLVYCEICEHPLERKAAHSLCLACYSSLPLIKDPRCQKCGKPLEKDLDEYCSDCIGRQHLFDAGLSVYEYTSSVRDLIYRYKYIGQTSLARPLASFMADLLQEADWRINLLVPVPLHTRKLKYRGFNQSALLADFIGHRHGIPIDGKALIRRVDTDKQASLTRAEREKNLKGAFEVAKPSTILDKNILLIDDVYT
ncbi:MAG TPA: ComF family protein, partial [Bacillota bacterium]|nr:ComF family protein [Bacillota bacterium]